MKKICLLLILLFLNTYSFYWENEYQFQNCSYTCLNKAIRVHPNDPEGGFLIVGIYKESVNYEAIAIRYNARGEKLWSYNYAKDFPYPQLYGAKAAVYTDDMGFIITSNNNVNNWLRIDKNGVPVSTANFPNKIKEMPGCHSIEKTNVGFVSVGSDVTFYDNSLNVQKSVSINSNSLFDVEYYDERVYIASTGSANDVKCYYSNGNIDNNFGNNGVMDIGSSLGIMSLAISKDKFFVAGLDMDAGWPSPIGIYQFNKTGSMVGTKIVKEFYPGLVPGLSISFNLSIDKSGYLIMSGRTGEENDNDFFISRFDSNGNDVASTKIFPHLGNDGSSWRVASNTTVRGDVIIAGSNNLDDNVKNKHYIVGEYLGNIDAAIQLLLFD